MPLHNIIIKKLIKHKKKIFLHAFMHQHAFHVQKLILPFTPVRYNDPPSSISDKGQSEKDHGELRERTYGTMRGHGTSQGQG